MCKNVNIFFIKWNNVRFRFLIKTFRNDRGKREKLSKLSFLRKKDIKKQSDKRAGFMRYKKYFIFIIMIIISSCNKDEKKDVILARVGDDVITVKDFKYNYETGFPHLKKKPDPKRSYLEYMIKEKLLSLDGYKRGFDKSPRVKKFEKELLNELLVE